MIANLDRATAVMMAIKVVEPGQKKDIAEALVGLFKSIDSTEQAYALVDSQIDELRKGRLIHLYYGSRYLVTEAGRDFIMRTGLSEKLEQRRMFLLKETRKRTHNVRSDTRDRSL